MSDKRILVIAAHPDDEILGCGGTVALHASQGDRVWAIVACEGESHRYARSGGVGQAEHMRRAHHVLAIEKAHMLAFPDQKLDTFTLCDLITPIENIVRDFQPSIVYCQHGADINRDHELLFKAILVATRPVEPYIEAVYAFDTASSTEWAYPRAFIPDTWVDIGSTLETKLEAMACYESELRPYPHPRSLEALRYKAYAWGNQCCIEAAEVFMTVRRVARDAQTPV
jgi:LmbE family N-acetylglucosaminyl deacetylase